MQRLSSHYVLSLLLILGIITATVSPACKFISGQAATLIEICTAQGLQTIPVTGDKQAPGGKQHNTAKSCVFCFSAHSGKVITLNEIVSVRTPLPHGGFSFPQQDAAAIRLSLALPEARAPPA